MILVSDAWAASATHTQGSSNLFAPKKTRWVYHFCWRIPHVELTLCACSSEDNKQDAKKTVIRVFGFPPEMKAAVIEHFGQFGKIEERFQSASNWMTFRYASSESAQRALESHGRVIGKDCMIGVDWAKDVYTWLIKRKKDTPMIMGVLLWAFTIHHPWTCWIYRRWKRWRSVWLTSMEPHSFVVARYILQVLSTWDLLFSFFFNSVYISTAHKRLCSCVGYHKIYFLADCGSRRWNSLAQTYSICPTFRASQCCMTWSMSLSAALSWLVSSSTAMVFSEGDTAIDTRQY